VLAATRKMSLSDAALIRNSTAEQRDKYSSAADGYFTLLQSWRGNFVLDWKVLPVLKLSVVTANLNGRHISSACAGDLAPDFHYCKGTAA